MVKDKININIPAFSLRWSSVLPLIIGAVFIYLFILQWNSTGELRKENKELNSTNEKLLDSYAEIKEIVKSDSLFIVRSLIIIDSLKESDKKHRRESYNIRRKYEKLKIDYSSATTDDKWDIFTRAIDN